MKVRDFGNVSLDRLSRLGLRSRLAAQRAFGLTHNYQPDPFDLSPSHDPRACKDRFEAAEAVLQDLAAPSVLDVGCNQGYFTFRFAAKGGVCLGVDNDRAELMAARSRAEKQGVRNVAFLEMTLDANTIPGLPINDVVVCLSVFHHWVRHYSQEGACDMLALLAKKTNDVLVFDTGQPEEITTSWSHCLNFMRPDGPQWIEYHLKSIGFKRICNVGTFPTSLSSVNRSLFVARR